MQNRISDTTEERDKQDDGPQPIGDILEELLVQYERQFPHIGISVSETMAAAV